MDRASRAEGAVDALEAAAARVNRAFASLPRSRGAVSALPVSGWALRLHASCVLVDLLEAATGRLLDAAVRDAAAAFFGDHVTNVDVLLLALRRTHGRRLRHVLPQMVAAGDVRQVTALAHAVCDVVLGEGAAASFSVEEEEEEEDELSSIRAASAVTLSEEEEDDGGAFDGRSSDDGLDPAAFAALYGLPHGGGGGSDDGDEARALQGELQRDLEALQGYLERTSERRSEPAAPRPPREVSMRAASAGGGDDSELVLTFGGPLPGPVDVTIDLGESDESMLSAGAPPTPPPPAEPLEQTPPRRSRRRRRPTPSPPREPSPPPRDPAVEERRARRAAAAAARRVRERRRSDALAKKRVRPRNVRPVVPRAPRPRRRRRPATAPPADAPCPCCERQGAVVRGWLAAAAGVDYASPPRGCFNRHRAADCQLQSRPLLAAAAEAPVPAAPTGTVARPVESERLAGDEARMAVPLAGPGDVTGRLLRRHEERVRRVLLSSELRKRNAEHVAAARAWRGLLGRHREARAEDARQRRETRERIGRRLEDLTDSVENRLRDALELGRAGCRRSGTGLAPRGAPPPAAVAAAALRASGR